MHAKWPRSYRGASYRRRHAFEFVQPALFDNEKTGDLPLDVCRDQHCTWLGGALNACGYVGRLAEHFAGVVTLSKRRREAGS
jgi:hypothetical protein